MRALSRLYRPITGTPFQAGTAYREVAPRAELAPYIRCFWGSERPLPSRPNEGGIVIPDTCMDIIFNIDYAQNRIFSSFCALDEHSFFTGPASASGGMTATFAIRFYAWTAQLFAEDTLRGSVNRQFPADAFFRRIEQALLPVLFEEPTLTGKIVAAENALLTRLNPNKADAAVLNAIHHILRSEGRARISDVSAALALSSRQLERRFDAVMGVSPKQLAGLMRYQQLWQDMALTRALTRWMPWPASATPTRRTCSTISASATCFPRRKPLRWHTSDAFLQDTRSFFCYPERKKEAHP